MVADSNRRGIRHLLPEFWDHARDHGLPLPCDQPVSAASICEARQKLSSDMLKDLLYEIAWPDPKGTSPAGRRWRGKRVFAVDGAKVNLRRHPELTSAFGVPEGSYCPQALVSILSDVCARVPVDVEVSGYATSERDHLAKFVPFLDAGDILVLDRGYPSHDLLQTLCSMGIDFLIRVPKSHTFGVIDEFRERGFDDRVMAVDASDESAADRRPLRVRVVALAGPSREPAYYVTSLPRSRFSRTDLAELYHMRWEAEELFKLFKSEYIGQGQLRSLSKPGVEQEICALVLFLAIAQVCASAAKQHVPGNQEFPSQKGAVLCLATYLPRVLLDPDHERAVNSLERAIQRILAVRDKRRPGRSHPRRSFKPGPRWGPAGRRGA